MNLGLSNNNINTNSARSDFSPVTNASLSLTVTQHLLQGFGSAAMVLSAGLCHDAYIGAVSLFWLLIVAADFFFDGGSAIMGPYAAEVWPSKLRTSGMGSAYGFGGIGKIIGPIGLALIVGSSNIVKP